MRPLVVLAICASLLLCAPLVLEGASLAVFTDVAPLASNAFDTGDWTTVQSGTATSTGNGTTTVSINSVDASKAFLVFQTRHNSNRPPGSMVRGQILNATTLEFVRVTDETSTISITWSVVEHPRVNVQRGEVIQDATVKN